MLIIFGLDSEMALSKSFPLYLFSLFFSLSSLVLPFPPPLHCLPSFPFPPPSSPSLPLSCPFLIVPVLFVHLSPSFFFPFHRSNALLLHLILLHPLPQWSTMGP